MNGSLSQKIGFIKKQIPGILHILHAIGILWHRILKEVSQTFSRWLLIRWKGVAQLWHFLLYSKALSFIDILDASIFQGGQRKGFSLFPKSLRGVKNEISFSFHEEKKKEKLIIFSKHWMMKCDRSLEDGRLLRGKGWSRDHEGIRNERIHKKECILRFFNASQWHKNSVWLTFSKLHGVFALS